MGIINIKDKIFLFFSLSASQHHVWVFPLLLEKQQKLRM
jgi:hypothetical protein